MRLILLTRAMEPSAEVLPALGLLAHHVRTMPAEATALLNAPACDALLVDGRRDLPAVRGLTRLLRQTGRRRAAHPRHHRGRPRRDPVGLGHGRRHRRHQLPGRGGGAPAPGRCRACRTPSAPPAELPEEIRSGELHIDEGTYTAKLRGRTLDLTFKEFELLKFLAQHPGRVFTRAVLLQEVWGYDYFGGTRTVDVHVGGCARSWASSTRA